LTKKKPRCLICKYTKPNEEQTVKVNYLYPGADKSIRIILCESHSVELFKSGQRSFLTQYYSLFQGFYGNEEDAEVINFAKSVVSGAPPPAKKPY
jgi:hypothetical protein